MSEERVRMELYREIYAQWSPKIEAYAGRDIAEVRAQQAVEAFDREFNVPTASNDAAVEEDVIEGLINHIVDDCDFANEADIIAALRAAPRRY